MVPTKVFEDTMNANFKAVQTKILLYSQGQNAALI